ncbi:MAG: HAD family phosphatase [Enhydrobacter sp.]|nr:HAD family phosphatase [Enhydrobacter sp.]
MMLPRVPAAVVFDMDGLLFDTETLYEQSSRAAARELGFDMTQEFFRSTAGSPWPVVRGQLIEHFGPALVIDELHAVSRRIFHELIDSRSLLKPGAVELLDLLDELKVPRAIATSSSRATVERHLETHQLSGRFHRIVAHGDYERHKPDPEPYLKAAEGLAVPPPLCLALEDSHHGVRSASSAGMMTIMVPDLLPATDELRALCLHVMTDLHDVHHVILASRQAA